VSVRLIKLFKKFYTRPTEQEVLMQVKGSEQGGLRPAVIIQNDIGNEYSSKTIIAPIQLSAYSFSYILLHTRLTEHGLKSNNNRYRQEKNHKGNQDATHL